MYDYNFPEQLSTERLTMLLLSLVIPTETAVLKDIYKRKKRLEEQDDYTDQDKLRVLYHPNPGLVGVKINRFCWASTRHMERMHCNICSQIRALYPGFIMYIIDSSNPVTDEVVHALPLTTCKDPKWSPYSPTPSGVSVINHVFQEPPLTFMEGAGIYDVGRQRLRGRLWPSYFNTTYRMNGGGLQEYVSDHTTLDKMQKEFRKVSDIFEECRCHRGGDFWYETIEELNEDKGIRVDINLD
jgi:hypothetical protein